MRAKKIGIFGGAFDPPHIGHIEVVQRVLLSDIVDEVWIVPSGRRVEKEMEASAKDRLAMCRLLFRAYFGNDHRVLIRNEQTREDAYSFSIDMVRSYKKRYPSYEFWLVIGDDVLPDVPRWKEAETLLENVPFLIMERWGVCDEGVKMPRIYRIFPYGGGGLPHFRFLRFCGEIPKYSLMARADEISSTFIRNRRREGGDISVFVGKEVAEYIRAKKLYEKGEDAMERHTACLKRIRLRPIEERDANIIAALAQDPAMAPSLSFFAEGPPTVEKERLWIAKMRKSMEESGPDYVFAVETRDGKEFIGTAGLHEIDRKNKNARVGILIANRRFRGRGYAAEILKAVQEHAFRKLRMHKVYMSFRTDNEKMLALVQKLGYRRVGVLKEEYFWRGMFLDFVRYELIAAGKGGRI